MQPSSEPPASTLAGIRRHAPVVVLVIVFCALKADAIRLPYHWDEISAYAGPTLWLAEGSQGRVLPGHHPPGLFFGHPPALHLLVAAAFRVLGDGVWVPHVVTLAFAVIAILATYLLGSHLGGRATGLVAAAFLAATPMFFSQSVLFLADVPMGAAALLAFHFSLTRRPGLALASGLFMVLVKQQALAFAGTLLVHEWLFGRGEPRRAWRLASAAVPIAAISAWCAWELAATGKPFTNDYFADHPFVVPSIQVWKWLFVKQGRWVLVLLIAAACVVFRRRFWRREFNLLALAIAAVLAIFSFVYFLPRYLVPVLPLLCVLGACALTSLTRRLPAARWIGAAAVVALFALHWKGSGTGYASFDEDMQYADVVSVHREACAYLERSHADARILALWPLSDEMKDPRYGFVGRPLHVVGPGEESDLVAISPQGLPGNAGLARTAKEQGLDLLERFERNGKQVEIFRRR